jgi:Zn-finger nucleic acid-binding protein
MPPSVQAPPPAPSSAALCPVCRAGTLTSSEHKGLLHTAHEVVCDRCGAVLVDHGGQPQRFELTKTRNPAEPNWQRYKHKALTVAEWHRIAAGGLADAELAEADLAEAMSELRCGRIRLQAAANPPILLHAGEQAVFVLADISLHEPRAVTRGAYGGPSIHVARGLTLRVGGFQAQSHEELKAIDSGTLVLTSKRLCYAGRLRAIEVALAKLISVDPYSDAVAIRRSGKEKIFFGLDHHLYRFTIEGRSYQEPMSGLILKYAIEGLLARG